MTELLRLSGRVSDLAEGLTVRRILPSAARRAVGPFVFFDHFGPVTLQASTDSDVGGHPHIGLATVSYLFEGSLLHRDSLGTVQTITPGAINWMTAGRGIVHSERVTDAQRGKSRRLHGLQLWVALPPARETCDPAFQHVPAADLPTLEQNDGILIRVLVGAAFGVQSPVLTASPTLYLDLQLAAHREWTLPPLAAEMALYSPEHSLQVNGQAMAAQEMAVLPTHSGATLRPGPRGARLVVIGGAPLAQPVRMWWNFVASDRERIAEAARRWADGGFATIPGEIDRIAAPPWRG
ncbi:pirin family protein [Rhodoferax sp.]|uniref:pirin family protein n=1 Tax=Rhodoferax sp. TaxID=50421 RepID=UPI0025E9A067|nr:pirin family protein [Rhodoferax sp.]MCM2295847.1 pirin family protein [Rhodoferax sp.]